MIVILLTLSLYTFRDMPKMLIEGEGFYWLNKGLQSYFWRAFPRSLANLEVSAVLVGTLLTKMFGANLYLYNWTWLFVMMVINIFMFFMAYVITKNKLVSFGASLIFAVNYIAQWGYLGWTYTSFLERTITVVFLIPSFLYLHLYMEKSKLKYFVISIALCFLGIGIGQWGLLFSVAFVVYPLFWHLFDFKAKKKILKRIFTSFTFLMICLFFLGLHNINQSSLGPGYSFTSFLLNPKKHHYIEQIPFQLSHWSNYPNIFKGLIISKTEPNLLGIGYKGSIVQNFSDLEANKKAANKILAIYLLTGLIIYLRLPKQRALLFTMIISITFLMITSIYFGRYIPSIQAGATRYMYLPTIWLSVYWALVLWALFWQQKSNLQIFGFIILVSYYLINTQLISNNLKSRLYSKTSNMIAERDLVEYIKNITPKLSDNTLVITPWDETSCPFNQFFNDQLGKGRVNFMLEQDSCAPEGGWKKVALESDHVIRLDYDHENLRVIEEKIK